MKHLPYGTTCNIIHFPSTTGGGGMGETRFPQFHNLNLYYGFYCVK